LQLTGFGDDEYAYMPDEDMKQHLVPRRGGKWEGHPGRDNVLCKNTKHSTNNPAGVRQSRLLKFEGVTECAACHQTLPPARHAKGAHNCAPHRRSAGVRD